MKLIFVCPVKNAVFESDDYRIVENKGVVVDAAGGRTLDAKVALERACPHCGGMHVFAVNELSCPWGGSQG